MTLQEVLRQNKIRVRQQRLAQIKHERKIRRCKNILACVVVSVLVISTMIATNEYNKKVINECAKEHDINYCIAGLS